MHVQIATSFIMHGTMQTLVSPVTSVVASQIQASLCLLVFVWFNSAILVEFMKHLDAS